MYAASTIRSAMPTWAECVFYLVRVLLVLLIFASIARTSSADPDVGHVVLPEPERCGAQERYPSTVQMKPIVELHAPDRSVFEDLGQLEAYLINLVTDLNATRCPSILDVRIFGFVDDRKVFSILVTSPRGRSQRISDHPGEPYWQFKDAYFYERPSDDDVDWAVFSRVLETPSQSALAIQAQFPDDSRNPGPEILLETERTVYLLDMGSSRSFASVTAVHKIGPDDTVIPIHRTWLRRGDAGPHVTSYSNSNVANALSYSISDIYEAHEIATLIPELLEWRPDVTEIALSHCVDIGGPTEPPPCWLNLTFKRELIKMEGPRDNRRYWYDDWRGSFRTHPDADYRQTQTVADLVELREQTAVEIALAEAALAEQSEREAAELAGLGRLGVLQFCDLSETTGAQIARDENLPAAMLEELDNDNVLELFNSEPLITWQRELQRCRVDISAFRSTAVCELAYQAHRALVENDIEIDSRNLDRAVSSAELDIAIITRSDPSECILGIRPYNGIDYALESVRTDMLESYLNSSKMIEDSIERVNEKFGQD